MRARLTQTRTFLKKFASEFFDDRIDDVAAMMTYYAVFALFPLMLLVITGALLILPTSVIDDALMMTSHAIPRDVSAMLTEQVHRMEGGAAGFAIGSALLALWGASRGASALMLALNDVFEKRETRSWIRRQLIAIGTTLLVSLLLVVALVMLTVGPTLGHALAERFGLDATFDVGWNVARWLVAALLVMVVWALLYKLLPDTDAPFRIFTPGAIAGVTLWFLITQAFGYYLDTYASYDLTYGTLAVVVVFLLWLWLSNLALLVGAEINDVLAELRKDKSPAAAELARATLRQPAPAKA